jgi:hypothetical protein
LVFQQWFFTVLQMLPQPCAVDKTEVDARSGSAVVPCMKYLVAAAALYAAAAAAVPNAPRHVPDLRQTLQQYHPGSTAPAPRQLSPVERAELRRQLVDQARPVRRR